MDYNKLISELRIELETLNSAIREIETLHQRWQAGPSAVKRRGRKFMAEEERQRVSVRMKQYWAERRATCEPRGSGKHSLAAGGDSFGD